MRKGGRSPGLAHAVQAAFAGYGIELEQLGVRARAGACTSRFSNHRIDAVTNQYDLELRARRSWDLAAFSFDAYLLIGVGTGLDLGCGCGMRLGASAETHFLRVDSATRSHAPAEFAPRRRCAGHGVLGRPCPYGWVARAL